MMKLIVGIGLLVTGLSVGFASKAPADTPPSLMEAYATIHSHRFVDLTHGFAPGIAHWPGFPNETVRTLFTIKKDGFLAQMFCHVGQWGTHVDAPAHFAPGGATVDEIDPRKMFLPLVVLDVHEKVARNPDYVITMGDVRAWEAAHGTIPVGAFVAMRTDWSKRWPSQAAMENKDRNGVAHYPGWSMSVLQYLYLNRHAVATGHETTDTDPGIAASHGDYSLESWLLHHGHYQIEMLANLDQVPESGSLAIVTFPKPIGGSGFPARVIAIVP
ncbi:MAG: cyclase family protein [Candidatus Eremiobacteraeota bacterium]|nr:cyclase family protein [Candidatus Eremiobacteraeota bacterium]